MTAKAVTDEQIGGFARRVRDLQERLEKGVVPYEATMSGLQALIEAKTDWIEKLVRAEEDAHQAFFGQTYDLSLFRQTLESYGKEKVQGWQKLGLEVHFLPKVVFTPDQSFPGWKVKPSDWFWQNLAAGKIKRHQADGQLATVRKASLEGIVALIDPRLKPTYQDGQQMFANDKEFMGSLIGRLRKEKIIALYDFGPQTSRFGISSPDEWQDQVRPAVAGRLKLEPDRVRLELAIEANLIPQLYPAMPRQRDGETDSWVWYEEYFEGASCRLDGGDARCGGLANVCWFCAGGHWSYRAVRPLGVLAP